MENESYCQCPRQWRWSESHSSRSVDYQEAGQYRLTDVPDRRSPSKFEAKAKVSGTTTSNVCLGVSHAHIAFGGLYKLGVPVLCGTSFIAWYIRLIHLDGWEIVLHNNLLVGVRMVLVA